MKLFLKIILMSLIIAVAQAKEPAYEGDGADCTSSDFLNKTQLSCIACGLKKAGRPVPDDHFLATMGLIVRESTSLFEDETTPLHSAANSPGKKSATRRSINGLAGHVYETKSGPVEYTARAKMQRNVIEMLLSSGYCTPGKIKSKEKNTDYKNFIARMTSDKYVVTGDEKKLRDKAAREIGQYDYDNAKEEFFSDASKPSFFEMSFDQQKEFYKKRRTSALNRMGDDTGARSNSEIPTCLSDIEQNYSPTYSSAQEAYTSCTAIYESCGIATFEGSTKRKNSKGREVRVGGDWCASKYKVAVAPIAKEGKSAQPVKAEKLRDDGTPPAPVEDKSFRQVGTIVQQGNKVSVGPQGLEVDMTKIKYGPKGEIIIPQEAIKSPASTGTKATPEATPAPAPQSQAPAVKVDGQPKATPGATK